ncbi:TetR/AcrR family transcriptional regulator [Amycolatopsis suaedae]|uniref:TetR family transcriptional regulator n=1 Tax=Amycolatopsis suaedae TaxID=2510978 RepID=A0A4V2ELU1_9PSEU|nr:TetR family transcriptional regulator [Amycolatopsis suaedae]RZQ62745.1 TetR family transcriptional regulator [Amycolatopsis suaedae]
MSTGLRALKKQQTRENISRQATALFLQRGFDDVTISEIAAAAQVAKMTVTNYFPRKEDIALDRRDEFVAAPVRAVAEREPGESALAALRRSFLAAVERHDPVIGFSGPEFARMIAGSPALLARLREFHDDRERALADAFAEESEDAVLRGVAATLLIGVLRLLFEETMRRTLAGQPDDEIATAVAAHARRAFGVLEPGLGHYLVRVP